MLIASLIILQVIVFSGLIVFLRKIINQNVVKATKHLEQLDEDYSKREKELSRRMEEVKQKSQELLARTREEAEKMKEEIAKEAERERDKMVKEARAQGEDIIKHADRSKQILISEVNDRIAKEAVDKACELVQETLPEDLKKGAHSKWVEELIESDFSKVERLQVPEDVEEVNIATAFSLDEEQRKAMHKKINDILGRDVKINERIDPKVVAGLVITIGNLVLDGSLKHRIKEKAKNT
ncbi:MAG: F0F1 ATP synthase subunit delta [Candidatus Omnitrophota bacterium]